MIIHGREIKFRRTVEATCELADKAPDGDINKYDKLLNSPKYSVTQKAAAEVIAALSKGYEKTRKYEEPGYVMNPLTLDEVLTLDEDTFTALFTEAMNAWQTDGKTTVETEPPKEKGKNGNGDGE